MDKVELRLISLNWSKKDASELCRPSFSAGSERDCSYSVEVLAPLSHSENAGSFGGGSIQIVGQDVFE